MGVDQGRGAVEWHRHRIDGEVTAGEVVGEVAVAHLRQRARGGIGLRPGAGEVHGEAVQAYGRGAEALVDNGVVGQAARDLDRVALDDDVHVDALLAAQQVTDGAADQMRLGTGRRLAQALDARERADPRLQDLGVDLVSGHAQSALDRVLG